MASKETIHATLKAQLEEYKLNTKEFRLDTISLIMEAQGPRMYEVEFSYGDVYLKERGTSTFIELKNGELRQAYLRINL